MSLKTSHLSSHPLNLSLEGTPLTSHLTSPLYREVSDERVVLSGLVS